MRVREGSVRTYVQMLLLAIDSLGRASSIPIKGGVLISVDTHSTIDRNPLKRDTALI